MTTPTQLERLIQQSVDRSVLTTLTRHADHVTESLVEEILRDPATKAQFAALISAAITRALANLNAADGTTP